ncbi:hypothetical protein BKA59DRAFT_457695 [Fusarium tricinctum]|uniref:Uncharacterized protein n=1 Tax=Fusarium tricinctum TaxID=61284 RepID=A0A8K0RQL6_9HYPO|nr:hypothetical protein BKA59DRAFT_457695 [Fusarium tricinctum]
MSSGWVGSPIVLGAATNNTSGKTAFDRVRLFSPSVGDSDALPNQYGCCENEKEKGIAYGDVLVTCFVEQVNKTDLLEETLLALTRQGNGRLTLFARALFVAISACQHMRRNGQRAQSEHFSVSPKAHQDRSLIVKMIHLRRAGIFQSERKTILGPGAGSFVSSPPRVSTTEPQLRPQREAYHAQPGEKGFLVVEECMKEVSWLHMLAMCH